ncbi:MAG TPA: hypothetical protein VMT79_11300 [Candidatus Binatia bacterium]|nr:hypothetical protein [Candidatus Binatia bacterium]
MVRVDWYLKGVLTVVAVALIAVAANLWAVKLDLPLAEAQAPPPPKYDLTIPKAWGKFIGYSNGNLILETADGLRVVDIEGRPPEYPKVKALIRWN